eukprot:4282088-Amphidinium_carterae.1
MPRRSKCTAVDNLLCCVATDVAMLRLRFYVRTTLAVCTSNFKLLVGERMRCCRGTGNADDIKDFCT